MKEGTVVNPFNETSSELITLDTGEVMDPAIVVCLKNAPTIGKNMFTEFVTHRIEEASKPLSDVIKKPNLYTFSNRQMISHYLFQITGFQGAIPACMWWFLKTLCPYLTSCQIAKMCHQVRNLHENMDIPTPLLCDLVKEGTVVNPFNETSLELITLDTGEVMNPFIIDCLKNAPTIRKNMFTKFVNDRFEEASKPLSNVIKQKTCTYSQTDHQRI